MRSSDLDAGRRPPERLLPDVATYARDALITSRQAFDTARQGLMDSLACGFMALADPDFTRALGSTVHGATLAGGARVPGTSLELEPVRAAFSIGAMIGWLGCNDSRLAVRGCHPADTLGGILAVADYLARKAVANGREPPVVRDVLTAMIKAHEIRATGALGGRPDDAGPDRVDLVRLATTAVATAMLGASLEQVASAVSHAWADDVVTDASGPGSGMRWAACGATSRGVWHALSALDTSRPSSPAIPAPGLGGARPGARLPAPQRFAGSHSMGKSRSAAASRAVVARVTARFERSVAATFPVGHCRRIASLFADASRLDAMPVNEFVAQFVRN